MRLASLISRELPIRKQQAAQGVTIAAAGLDQAEWETIYAVTRNYFSVIYASKQEAVARGLVNKLKAAQEKAGLSDQGGQSRFRRHGRGRGPPGREHRPLPASPD